MIENTGITFNYSMSDEAVLRWLGAQLKQMRLNKNCTQQQLGELSGLSRSTVSEMENGSMGTVLSLIQALRALEKLQTLNVFITEAPVSPLQIAKLRGKERRRASGKNSRQENKEAAEW